MKIFHSKHSSGYTPVVWTNGCYDVLHVGHASLFTECYRIASSNKYSFVVGVDSDKRVKQLKGSDRPVNTEDNRAEMLLSIRGVDRVFVYDTEEELKHIVHDLCPQVMVIGDEYRNRTVIGSEYAKSVVFFPKVKGYSTTSIIQKLNQVGNGF